MSEAPPTATSDYAVYWRHAWFAVWSPPLAWLSSIAVLLMGGRFQAPGVAAAAGFAIGLCGLMGIFVVVPCALDALLATLDAPNMTGRERARLSYLSLLGVIFSLFAYGCLAVLGGLVLMLSPFAGFQI